MLAQATEILPEIYIRRWALLQKWDRLYNLLKDIDPESQLGEADRIKYSQGEVQEDVKEVFREVLKERLRKKVKQMNTERLIKAQNNTKRYDLEMKIIYGEIENRMGLIEGVQYWTT